ncbi:MAG: hypothetical protein QOJ42_384 [Acidobacteriaceae bacterium]|jgi:hypothetical protein|nr:hypothetical protein [Acidobacteriaceae bacterium]
MQSPAEYRTMAELCRRHAEEINDGRDKARWLRIAEGWMLLARNAVRASNVTATTKTVLPVVSEQRV